MRLSCVLFLLLRVSCLVATPPTPFDPIPLNGSTNALVRPLFAWSGSANLLTNGGFEDGLVHWNTEISPSGAGRILAVTNFQSIQSSVPRVKPLEGASMVLLRLFEPGRLSLQREFQVPNNGRPSHLSFSQWINTRRTSAAGFDGSYVAELSQLHPITQQPIQVQRINQIDNETLTVGWTRRLVDVSRFAGQTIRFSVSAKSQSGTLEALIDDVQLVDRGETETEYEVLLGESPQLGTNDFLGRTRQTTIQAPLTRPGSTNYWQVIAKDKTGVQPGPVWRFISGGNGLTSRFQWETPRMNAVPAAPSEFSLSAYDSNGNHDALFSEPVRVVALSVDTNAPKLLLTGIQHSFNLNPSSAGVSVGNVGNNTIPCGGWKLTVWNQARWPEPIASVTFPIAASLAAGRQVVVRGGGSTPGVFPNLNFQTPLYWGRATSNHLAAAMLQDSNGEIIDFVAVAGADPKAIQNPKPLPPWQWIGASLPMRINQSVSGLSWFRQGTTDTHTPFDWNSAEFFPQTVMTTRPMKPSPIGVEISPPEVELVGGLWTGLLTFSNPPPNVEIVAYNTNGALGRSILSVSTNLPLRLLLPERIREDAGTLLNTAKILLPKPAASNVTVALANTHPRDLIVPESLEIPAGTSEFGFSVTLLDDPLRDGSVEIRLTPTAFGYTSVPTRLWIDDSEFGQLSLELPASVIEGEISSRCYVVANPPPELETRVKILAQLAPGRFHETEVRLAAGQVRAPFRLPTINNSQLNNTHSILVQAIVQNWATTPGTISIVDDDRPTLSLTLPFNLTETNGKLSNQGRIVLGGSIDTNLILRLQSSNPSRLQVPELLVVPAGKRELLFDLTLADNPTAENLEEVVITATASGFVTTSGMIRMLDNDAARFAIDEIASPQEAERSFNLHAKALAPDGSVVTEVIGPWNLYLVGSGDPVPITPILIRSDGNGGINARFQVDALGDGFRIAIDDGRGHRGESNPFQLVEPPYRVVRGQIADVAWSSKHHRLYAAVIGTAPNGADSAIAAIDPLTREFMTTVSLPFSPHRLTPSADGEFLYVVGGDGSMIRQYSLPELSLKRDWSVQPDFGSSVLVEDLAVMPGNPEVIAVARSLPNRSPRAAGVVIYDHGVARPTVLDSFTQRINRLEFSVSGDWLYGYENETTAFTFTRLKVDHTGVSLGDQVSPSPASSFALDFSIYEEWAAFEDGTIWNLNSGNYRRLNSLQGTATLATEPTRQRIYGLQGSGSDSRVQSFDFISGDLVSEFVLPGLYTQFGRTSRLLRWGENGLAALVEGTLAIFQSSIVPSANLVDIVLSAKPLPPQWITGHTAALQITVSNLVSGPIAGLKLSFPWQGLPMENVEFVYAGRILSPSIQDQKGYVVDLGTLPEASIAELIIRFIPTTAGPWTLTGFATPNAPEVDRVNNAFSLDSFVETKLARGQTSRLRFSVDSMVGTATRSNLWASQGDHKRLIELDPLTARIRRTLNLDLPSPFDLLALSPEGTRVYVASTNGRQIIEVDTESMAIVRQINLQDRFPSESFQLSHIAVRPGFPEEIAVILENPSLPTQQTQLILINAGSSFPSPEPSGTGTRIAFGSDGQSLYSAFSTPPGRRWKITAQGLVELPSVQPWPVNAVTDIATAGGHVYLSSIVCKEDDRLTRKGILPSVNLAASASLDPKAGLAFVKGSDAIEVFDLETLSYLAPLSVPMHVGGKKLVRWGSDGLAWWDAQAIGLHRTHWLPLNSEEADLAVSLETAGVPTTPNGSIRLQIQVRNHGPGHANSTRLSFSKPHDSKIEFSTEVQRIDEQYSLNFEIGLGDLAPGAVTNISANLIRDYFAAWPFGVRVSSDSPDLVHSNQLARAVLNWAPAEANPQLFGQELNINHGLWAAPHRVFVLSLGYNALRNGNTVVTFDPATRRFGKPKYFGSLPSQIALADDGSRAYIALDGSAEVVVCSLPDLVEQSRFSLNTMSPPTFRNVQDSLVIAGQPSVYVASVVSESSAITVSTREIVLFRNGQKMPREIPSDLVTFIEPGAQPNTLWGLQASKPDTSIYRLSVMEDGLDYSAVPVGFGMGDATRIGGYLVSGSGPIVDLATGGFVATLPLPLVGDRPLRHWITGESDGSRVYALPQTATTYIGSYIPGANSETEYQLDPGIGSYTALRDFQRWGVDGFAFASQYGWVLFRSPVVIPNNGADWDADGLPDVWEQANGTDPHRDDRHADPDADGFDNAAELAAGSSPNDPTSVFKLHLQSAPNGGWQLETLAQPNRRYQLNSSGSFDGPWKPLGAPIDTSGAAVARIVFPLPPATGSQWFRLSVTQR